MPAFTYSHRYLQFLTDRLVNLPQYQQQLHWTIRTEITNKGKKLSINFQQNWPAWQFIIFVVFGMCYSNASFYLSVSSVPHWLAGHSASIFSLAGWKIPVFLLFNITRSGNDRSPGNLNKLEHWLKSSSFRLSRQRAHLQEFALIRLPQYCAVCNELLSIVFVFRNRNI
jgi:hypothetical protein